MVRDSWTFFLRMKRKKPTFYGSLSLERENRKEMAGRDGGGRDRNGVTSMLWCVGTVEGAEQADYVRPHGLC